MLRAAMTVRRLTLSLASDCLSAVKDHCPRVAAACCCWSMARTAVLGQEMRYAQHIR